MIEEGEIMERWREYFEELLNEENEHELEEVEEIEGPIENVTEEEVKRALGGMKSGKAAGPSELTSGMLMMADEIGVQKLTQVFERIMRNEKVPEE